MSNGSGDGWLKGIGSFLDSLYATKAERRQSAHDRKLQGIRSTAIAQAQVWHELSKLEGSKQWMEAQRFEAQERKNREYGGIVDQLSVEYPGGTSKGTADRSKMLQDAVAISLGQSMGSLRDADSNQAEFDARQAGAGAQRAYEAEGASYGDMSEKLNKFAPEGSAIMAYLSKQMKETGGDAQGLLDIIAQKKGLTTEGGASISPEAIKYWTTGFGSNFLAFGQASASGGFTNPAMYARTALDALKATDDYATGRVEEEATVGFYLSSGVFDTYKSEKEAQRALESGTFETKGAAGYNVMETTDGKWAVVGLPLDGPALTIPDKFDMGRWKTAQGVEDMSAYYDADSAPTSFHEGLPKSMIEGPPTARDKALQAEIDRLTRGIVTDLQDPPYPGVHQDMTVDPDPSGPAGPVAPEWDPMGQEMSGEEKLNQTYQGVQEIGSMMNTSPGAISQEHIEFLQNARDTFARQVDPILNKIQEAQAAESSRQGAGDIIRQLRLGQTGFGIDG